LDELQEKFRGENSIGTTKRGIGPCYSDKTERSGIRMCDLVDEDEFVRKVRENLKVKNLIIEKYTADKNWMRNRLYPNILNMEESLRNTLRM